MNFPRCDDCTKRLTIRQARSFTTPEGATYCLCARCRVKRQDVSDRPKRGCLLRLIKAVCACMMLYGVGAIAGADALGLSAASCSAHTGLIMAGFFGFVVARFCE